MYSDPAYFPDNFRLKKFQRCLRSLLELILTIHIIKGMWIIKLIFIKLCSIISRKHRPQIGQRAISASFLRKNNQRTSTWTLCRHASTGLPKVGTKQRSLDNYWVIVEFAAVNSFTLSNPLMLICTCDSAQLATQKDADHRISTLMSF